MSNDQRVSLLFYKVDILSLQTRLIDILCSILFILGVIGNVLGLFIFSSSRRSWRISSIYVYLATCSSIINLLCVIRYASIVHSTSRYILVKLVGHMWWACKLYECSFSFRVISSWITSFWMFERLVCVSKRLRLFLNYWKLYKLKYIIPIMIIIIIISWVIVPPVYMFRPQIFENETINMSKIYCGIGRHASIEWQKYFHDIHFGMNHYTIRCLFSELIPTGVILLLNSYIIYHIISTYRRLHLTHNNQARKIQSATTSWMNIVLIFHSFLFLISIFSHIVGHFMFIEAHEAWWVSLAVLINCSLNFYIYCLSGKAFRNEFRRFIRRFKLQYFYKLQTSEHRQQQCCHYRKDQNSIDELRRLQISN